MGAFLEKGGSSCRFKAKHSHCLAIKHTCIRLSGFFLWAVRFRSSFSVSARATSPDFVNPKSSPRNGSYTFNLQSLKKLALKKGFYDIFSKSHNDSPPSPPTFPAVLLLSSVFQHCLLSSSSFLARPQPC